MIRTAIIERVGPLIEEFAGELAELLAQDFDRRIGQLGEAFAVATSAFAAELAGDQDVRDVGVRSLPPRRTVPEAAVVAEQASTSSSPARRAKGGGKLPTCTKCGFYGGNSRGCGTAHSSTSSPPPIKPGRADRFAAIEQAASRRDAAKRSRAERAASFVRRGRGPTRGVGRAELSDAGAVVELPLPVASFEL